MNKFVSIAFSVGCLVFSSFATASSSCGKDGCDLVYVDGIPTFAETQDDNAIVAQIEQKSLAKEEKAKQKKTDELQAQKQQLDLTQMINNAIAEGKSLESIQSLVKQNEDVAKETTESSVTDEQLEPKG